MQKCCICLFDLTKFSRFLPYFHTLTPRYIVDIVIEKKKLCFLERKTADVSFIAKKITNFAN